MTAWMELANCRGMDPNLFHPGKGGNDLADAAKQVCARCQVRDECLAYALDNNFAQGVWGGTSDRDRRRLRRNRERVA